MVFCHTFCAWGLSRPLSCSGTVATILVLGDCFDHSRARDCLDRPRARGLSRLPLCSGTVPTMVILGDSSFSPCCAQGLPRPLSDHCSGTALLGYM